MIRKKGILMDNVLGLIVAAIGIGLLIFFAVKLYGASVVQDEEKARTIIDSLEGKINNFNEGEIGKITIQGVSGWFITGWSFTDKERPDSCYFGSCLCICKGSGGDVKSECKNKGFCREFKGLDKMEIANYYGNTEWRDKPNWDSEEDTNHQERVYVSTKSIVLKNQLMDLIVKKEKGLIVNYCGGILGADLYSEQNKQSDFLKCTMGVK